MPADVAGNNSASLHEEVFRWFLRKPAGPALDNRVQFPVQDYLYSVHASAVLECIRLTNHVPPGAGTEAQRKSQTGSLSCIRKNAA